MIRFAAATPKQPSAILLTVAGSLPRAACRVHSATTNGVKAKIINGLKARNHVVGICEAKQNDGSVGIGVGPQDNGVAALLVSGPEQSRRYEQNQQRDDAAPFVGVERAPRAVAFPRLLQFVRR